jgi:hypothetical protein
MIVNFDDGTNPFNGGTVSTAQAWSGDKSLYLGMGVTALLDVPAEYLGQTFTVSMMIYDMGKWIDRTVQGYPTTCYGPRWGVSHGPDAGQGVGLAIIEKSYLASTSGYSYSKEGRFATSWFSNEWEASFTPRQTTLSDNGGTYDPETGTWTMGTEGVGQWTQWNFECAPNGDVTIWREGWTGKRFTTNIGEQASEIYFYGGRNHATLGAPLAGVYVDDVTVVPEPHAAVLFTVSILLLGRVRRRR